MADYPNYPDPAFPGDWATNEMIAQSQAGLRASIRRLALDGYGTDAVIFNGLTGDTGTNPNTIKVLAGSCRDKNKYPIVVAIDEDNLAVDVTGVWNYVAIKYLETGSDPGDSVKAGVSYNKTITEDYDIDITIVGAHAEAAGWVNLFRVRWIAGAFEFDYDVPLGYRSRSARRDTWSATWGYSGAVPVGPGVDMFHNDTQGARVHPETTVMIRRFQVSLATAGAGAAIDFQLTFNGGIPGWAPFISLAIGVQYGIADLGILEYEISPTDYLGCTVIGNAGLAAGGNAFARISGEPTSGVI